MKTRLFNGRFTVPNWMKFNLKPDFTIFREEGQVYLRRWYILPRNPFFNVYLHHFCQSDDLTHMHDHPWYWASIILKGGYWEHTPKGRFWRRSWRPRWGSGEQMHCVELAQEPLFDLTLFPIENEPKVDIPVWTLFITGPKYRDWGFDCGVRGWRPWWKYVKRTDDTSDVGGGCGG